MTRSSACSPGPVDAVRALLAERGLTFRALAARTTPVDPHNSGLMHSYLATLGRRDRPSPRAMEIVARALELKPTHFAEYRLALIRSLFDEQQQGLEGALENVAALRELVDAHGSEPPAGRLARVLAAADLTRSPAVAGAAERG